MKRKEIIETIANVGTKTFFTCGSMTLINKHDGTEVDVDMHSTFSVVRGTLAWFGDAAHAQALPATYTFAGEPGATTTLSWTFTPDASETNYVAEPATGDARFTLVAAQASGEHPAASGHSPTGSDAPSPLVRTGDRIAALPWVAAIVAATAAATACVLRRRKRQR